MNTFIEKDVKTFTEEELIIFVGAEDIFTTKTWINKGCLKKGNGTHKRLIEMAECHAEVVKMEGKGKKRIYTLSNLYDEPTSRVTGNSTNGRQAAGDVDLLEEYFFSQLVHVIAGRKESYSETFNEWGKKWVDMLSVSDANRKRFDERLGEIFDSILDEDIVKGMASNILENLRTHRKDLAVRHIEKLEEKKKIRTEVEYYLAYAKDSMVVELQEEAGYDPVIHQLMDDEKHAEIVKGIKKILDPFEISYGRFKVVAAFNHYAENDDEREAVRTVNDWLFQVHSIDYIYSRTRIWVNKKAIPSAQEISYKDARNAYIERVLQLTNDRMNRKSYKESTKHNNLFYRLSMFVLLDVLGVEDLKEQIEFEVEMIPEKLPLLGTRNNKSHFGFIDNKLVNSGDELIREINGQQDVSNMMPNEMDDSIPLDKSKYIVKGMIDVCEMINITAV